MLWASNTVLGECQMKDKFPEQLHPHEKKKNTCMHAGEKESKYTYLFQNFCMIDFFSNLPNPGALVANHAYN